MRRSCWRTTRMTQRCVCGIAASAFLIAALVLALSAVCAFSQGLVCVGSGTGYFCAVAAELVSKHLFGRDD